MKKRLVLFALQIAWLALAAYLFRHAGAQDDDRPAALVAAAA